jgi:hypothetical protein
VVVELTCTEEPVSLEACFTRAIVTPDSVGTGGVFITSLVRGKRLLHTLIDIWKMFYLAFVWLFA